ncbi:MAG: DNA adenine methylase [Magnetospirillum sp.]|nr:DNA adenine methylase [Magnetospirillum sp.]
MNPTHAIVKPLTPPAPYVGGKRLLAGKIADLIDAIPHDTYCEAFVGMAGVFLRRARRPKAEVINDASRDVATLFRILQRHYPQFMDTLRFQVTSRSRFEELARTDPSTLTDLERAARFLYLQRLTFGGKVASRTFGVDPGRPARFDLSTLAPRLEELHERLSGVVVECLDFEAFLERYDRPYALFYLDPPYVGSEGYYGKDMFKPADLVRLSERCRRLKGNFVLSNMDCPEVRTAFEGCQFVEAANTFTVGGQGRTKAVGEVIIVGPPQR